METGITACALLSLIITSRIILKQMLLVIALLPTYIETNNALVYVSFMSVH